MNGGKIVLEQDLYKYVEDQINNLEFGILISTLNNKKAINLEDAINYFLKNYVEEFCKKETVHQYKTIFKIHILPYFKNKSLNELKNNNILEFYEFCKNRGLQPRRIKNILALLNQLIKYFQNIGVIDKSCNFQVRRLTDKNKFNINRIIFEE